MEKDHQPERFSVIVNALRAQKCNQLKNSLHAKTDTSAITSICLHLGSRTVRSAMGANGQNHTIIRAAP